MADRSQHLEQIMENQTRFDLNAAIENWRQELAAQSNLTPEVRRELETHLRDSIAELRQRGLNDEESFWLARRRVGQPKQLGEEFAKADPAKVWRERVFWICLAAFLLVILEDTISSLTRAMMPVTVGSFLDRLMVPQILFLLRTLFPLIIVALLGSGKMFWQFSKLKLLIESRPRLAISAFTLIAISAALSVIASAYSVATRELTTPINHVFLIPVWQVLLYPTCYELIIVLLLVWLMPTQNRKTSKRFQVG